MESIHPRTIETTKKCLKLALPVFNLEEHRIKEHPVKSSLYPINLVFTSILVILLRFRTTAKHFKSPFLMVNYTLA